MKKDKRPPQDQLDKKQRLQLAKFEIICDHFFVAIDDLPSPADRLKMLEAVRCMVEQIQAGEDVQTAGQGVQRMVDHLAWIERAKKKQKPRSAQDEAEIKSDLGRFGGMPLLGTEPNDAAS